MELEGKGLTCERDRRILFENLDFGLRSGQVIQIEGSNGTGKTTLLRILCGLFGYYDGEVLWNGEPQSRVYEEFVSHLVYVGHASGIKGCLTAEENLRWQAALREEDVGDRDGIWAALAKVGLRGYEDVACDSMSAGQKKRVNLARLYLTQETSKLWILDEPFSSIDVDGVAGLEQLIGEHLDRGGMVVLTSHQRLQLAHPLEVVRLGAPA